MSQKTPFNRNGHQFNQDEELKPIGSVFNGENKQEAIVSKFPKQIFYLLRKIFFRNYLNPCAIKSF